MGRALRLRSVGIAVATFGAFVLLAAQSVQAYPLRAPQVPLAVGWDGYSLQTYMNSIGETMNTDTDQLNLQTWQAVAGSDATFTLKLEVAGFSAQNSIGIYNAGAGSPPIYLVFPGAASAGWYATCHFGSGGALVVYLYDDHGALQGSTSYAGVDRTNFGFYLQGPGGMFWSQDYRNAGDKAQVITYSGSGTNLGKFWECFEDLPYASSDHDYQDAILLLQSLAPTAAGSPSWGSLKARYR